MHLLSFLMKNILQNLYPKFETQRLTMISGKKIGHIFFTNVFCKHSFLLENSLQHRLTHCCWAGLLIKYSLVTGRFKRYEFSSS